MSECTFKVCVKWERVTKNNALIEQIKGNYVIFPTVGCLYKYKASVVSVYAF